MTRSKRLTIASPARSGCSLAAIALAALAFTCPASGAPSARVPRVHCKRGPRSGHHRPPATARCRHRQAPPPAAEAAPPPPPAPQPGAGVLDSHSAQPPAAPTPPSIGSVAESHRSWRQGRELAHLSASRVPIGTTFSFSLNERASVSLVFTQQLGGRRLNGRCVAAGASRNLPACTRAVWRGTIATAAHAGMNKLAFQGRLSRSRRLSPGTYSLLIGATNAVLQHARPKRLVFTIVK